MRGVVPALLLSLLVYPGAGQAYNRQWVKAAVFGLAFTVFAGGVVHCFGGSLDIAMTLLSSANGNFDPGPIVHSMSGAVPYVIGCSVVYVAAAVDTFRSARQTAPGGS